MLTQMGARPLLTWLGLPVARAAVRGGAGYPSLRGTVEFFRAYPGIVVVGEFDGLPCGGHAGEPAFFAMRVCTGAAGAQEDGSAQEDDLPPLLASRGYAFQAVYTERFQARRVIGGLVTVHARQPGVDGEAGGGAPIGCGAIERAR